MQVTISEASRRLAQLIRSVQSGDEVVIAEGNRPVARLVPAASPEVAETGGVGSAHVILDWLAQHPVPPRNRRSAEDINTAIAAERAAWD